MESELHFVDFSFCLLVFSTLLTLLLMRYVQKNKSTSQIQKIVSYVLSCLLIISTGLIVQKFCVVFYHVEPIYFEGFIYLGTCFLPVMIYLMAESFVNTKITLSNKHLLLFVIPTINVISIFTNNYHHLFYKEYSMVLNDMEVRHFR